MKPEPEAESMQQAPNPQLRDVFLQRIVAMLRLRAAEIVESAGRSSATLQNSSEKTSPPGLTT